MKTFSLFALSIALFISSSARADNPTVGGKVVINRDVGVELTIVNLKPAGDKQQALLLFSGTQNEFDGKVLPATVEDDRDRSRYHIQRRGQDYVPLIVQHGSSPRYQVYYPGMRADDIELKLDDEKSKSLKPEAIYKQFQKQGSIEAITKFNRAEPIGRGKKDLAEEQERFHKKCDLPIPFEVDWNGISDDILKDLSIGSYCGAPFEAMESLCDESKEAKHTFQSRIKKITCHFGAAQKLELEGATLKWTTARDASNQTQFARDYLLKNL